MPLVLLGPLGVVVSVVGVFATVTVVVPLPHAVISSALTMPMVSTASLRIASLLEVVPSGVPYAVLVHAFMDASSLGRQWTINSVGATEPDP